MSAAEPLPRESYYFGVTDTCDREGALRIAKAIQDYWAERGGVVNARIVNKGFSMITRAARFEVLTDMRNGLPNPEAKKLTDGPVEMPGEGQ